MKTPVRLGITGSGFMGLTHAEAASLVQETRLVAVAGGSRAPKLASQYHLDVEPDVAALVRRSDIDAVLITTPHHVHVGGDAADQFADLHLLEPLVKQLGARATLRLFPDADHSFHVPVSTGRMNADVRAEMLDVLAGWIEMVVNSTKAS